MHFEMTRADQRPDVAALEAATQHSREACRLAPDYGEAWATLGFVLDRTGRSIDALAASRRAVSLEPDNWRHHFRLAYVGWGEERLRAAHRTLALLPGFPLAHWLIATVHVARHALAEADRQLALGITSLSNQSGGTSRFSAVALHWLRGLIRLACGDTAGCARSVRARASSEGDGHLYGRECCANTGTRSAHCACNRAIVTPRPPHFARPWLASQGIHRPGSDSPLSQQPMLRQYRLRTATSVDGALGHAIALACAGKHSDAARIVDQALAAAPPGNAGWLIPVEPMLQVSSHPDIWASALARLRTRAA